MGEIDVVVVWLTLNAKRIFQRLSFAFADQLVRQT